jgi:hypothetical protein
MVYLHTKNPTIGTYICTYILEGLGNDNGCTFSSLLKYFKTIWYILRPFGIFGGYRVYSYPFWYVAPRQIWQPRPGCSKLCRQRNTNEKPSPHQNTYVERGGIVKFHLSSCLKGELSWGNWLRHFSSLRGSAVRN